MLGLRYFNLVRVRLVMPAAIAFFVIFGPIVDLPTPFEPVIM